LFNELFDRGIVPSDWDEGLILGLYKQKGDAADMATRRPIALLEALRKLYEHVLNQRALREIVGEKIIAEGQKGFHPGRVCSDAARTLATGIKKSNDEDAPVYVLFADLSKAFDTIPKWLIIQALEAHGFPAKFVDAVASLYEHYGAAYLTAYGLGNFVATGKRGCQQGAVMSPNIFSLVTNGFNWHMERRQASGVGIEIDDKTNLAMLAVADDTALLSKLWDEIVDIWHDYENFAAFCDLIFGLDKTRLAANDAARRLHAEGLPTLLHNGEPIEWLEPDEPYRYLGIEVTMCENWEHHEAKLLQSVKAACGMISSLSALPTSERAAILQSVVPGIVRYTLNVCLPSRSTLKEIDQTTAHYLRRWMRSAPCSDLTTLRLTGVQSMQILAPLAYLRSVAHGVLARQDKYTSKLERHYSSLPATTWHSEQFEKAIDSERKLKLASARLPDFLNEIDTLRASSRSIVPLHELAPLLGLTLVTGGPDSSLKASSSHRPKGWPDITDRILPGNLASELREEVETALNCAPGDWITAGTDGSQITDEDGIRMISSAVVLSTVTPPLPDDYVPLLGDAQGVSAYKEFAANNPNEPATFSHGFCGNGKANSYVAETLGWILFLHLAIILGVSVLLFSDSLSLITQLVKWRRLAHLPAAKSYTKFCSLIAAIDVLIARLERMGLFLLADHVFSHTDDSMEAGDRIEQERELREGLDRLFGRVKPDAEDEAQVIQARILSLMRQNERLAGFMEAALEEGVLDPAPHVDVHIPLDAKLGELELLSLRARKLTRKDKSVRSIEEKIAIMDARLGQPAREHAVALNKAADEKCDGAQGYPTPLGPRVPSTPENAIANCFGEPVLGYLASELDQRYRSLLYIGCSNAIISNLNTAPGVDVALSLWPLSEDGSRVTWTGRRLADTAFKLLNNTFMSGSKEARISRGVVNRYGTIDLLLNAPGLHTNSTRITDFLREEQRRADGLRANPLLGYEEQSCTIVRVQTGQQGLSVTRPRTRQENLHAARLSDLDDHTRDVLNELLALHWQEASAADDVAARSSQDVTPSGCKFSERRMAACARCIARSPDRLLTPLATTQHILWRCPAVGQDIAVLVRDIFNDWREHAPRGTPDDRFVPWFSIESALDWAFDDASDPQPQPATHLGTPDRLPADVRRRLAEQVNHTPVHDDAILKSWIRSQANAWNRSTVDPSWALQFGNRGYIPKESPCTTMDDFLLPTLFWKRSKIRILLTISKIEKDFRRARAIGNKLASSYAKQKREAEALAEKADSAQRNTLDRYAVKGLAPTATPDRPTPTSREINISPAETSEDSAFVEISL
jgi:hypothetical protein